MNFKIGDNIGPWIINRIIKSEQFRCILQVFLNKENEHLIDSDLGGIKYWIMKIMTKHDKDEYEIIKKYKLNDIEYSVKILKNDVMSHGKYENYIWYVMEEYCFDCSNKRNMVINEKKIISSIINFLRYIHREHKIIHGDIKLKNVLYKNGNYYVCDYESIKEPNNNELCDDNNSSNYYYYYIGCEYKKPIWSYRTDLEAVGYILWSIINNFHFLDFQKSAQYYYENDYEVNRYEKLDNIKEADFENIPDIVTNFFKITSKIDWFNLEPPSNEIYDEIINIFNEK
jgi:serine/threonine protein kinase